MGDQCCSWVLMSQTSKGTHMIVLNIILNHHQSWCYSPPWTQFSTNCEAVLMGSYHSPYLVPKGTRVGALISDTQANVAIAKWLQPQLASKTRRFIRFYNSHKYCILICSSSMQKPRYLLLGVILDSSVLHHPNEQCFRADKAHRKIMISLAHCALGFIVCQDKATEGESIPN